MGFFTNLFRRSQPDHALQLTDLAADVLKQLMKDKGITRPQDHCVVVNLNMDLHLIVDICDAAGHVRSRDFAFAVVKQLNVVIHIDFAEHLADRTLDFDQANNAFVFADGGFGSLASDPGNCTLSKSKLAKLNLDLQPSGSPIVHGPYEELVVGLQRGDSRAALVAQLSPLIVAAYSDELDAVALLRFPDWLVDEHQLQVGSRLLSINLYVNGNDVVSDLQAGPFYKEQFVNFVPRIAEFLSDDVDEIQRHHEVITESEWNRTKKFADAAMARPNVAARDGIPPNSHVPAKS